MSAAPVDVSAAKTKAEQYLAIQVYAGKYMAPKATQATLIKTEMGDITKVPVYFIFNTATTYVIVSGDDRAEEILAYGDKPLDIENIPCNMQAWLNSYKEQLDWLLAHPDAKVNTPTTYKSPKLRSTVIGPLLTAMWNQNAPFNDQCHFTYSGTSYECYAGCVATSASMVLYYWKHPVEQVGPLQGFTGPLKLGSSNSVSFYYPDLPAVTFDWDNMKDKYGTWYDENGTAHNESYTTAQGNAVATLMRYCGHAVNMKYGTSSSGISIFDSQNIANMFKNFGYDDTTRLVLKWNCNNWEQLLQEEIAEGRPVVFLATENGSHGHAFNVDGYDASTNKYHVNFGWSGYGNNWCALDAFHEPNHYHNFDSDHQMVIGIQPKMGVPVATAATEIKANDFTANWTASPNAASYMLRVTPKPASTLLMTETFANCTANGILNIGSMLNNYLDNVGWTGGRVYTAVGGVRLGNGSATGYITSPALDLTANNRMSVKFKAQTYNNDIHCGLKISCGNATETITVPDNNEAEYTVVLNCTPTDQKVKFETVVARKRVIITEVEFYSGDVTSPAPAMGSDEIIISDITNLNYKVTGLLPATTYFYDVKAVSGDKQSDWSKKVEVTTLADIPGDVNGDGEVGIGDVTAIIDLILSENTSSSNYGRADVNGDGEVNISDVTALIDIILHN